MEPIYRTFLVVLGVMKGPVAKGGLQHLGLGFEKERMLDKSV